MRGVKKLIKAIDIYNPEFNFYFTEKLNMMTPEQRNLLPIELSNKIFKKKNVASAGALAFNEIIYILSVVFKQNITIVVQDDKHGLSTKDFKASVEAQKGNITNGELLEKMQMKSAFILSDKQLMQSLLYMNQVNCGPLFTLLKEIISNNTHKRDKNYKGAKTRIEEIFKFLLNYETHKKRIATDFRLTMPEWYALLFFSTGEQLGNDFYNKHFKYSYNSDRISLFRGLNRLYKEGYLNRRGGAKEHRYSLSGSGINLLQRILDTIILKY